MPGRPFVPINCGAIPTELMESEFFSYKKGSFTGATSGKVGQFQTAEGGTLFLDEIGDLPLHMQVKQLRVIQEKAIRPVGQANELPIDVRIVSATYQDVGQLVAAGRFRQDLYYRINVIELPVPPLRERDDDLLILKHHILTRLAGAQDLPVPESTPGARAALLEYGFPGNVPELENILERALTLAGSETIDIDDIQLRPSAEGDEQEPLPDATAIACVAADCAPLGEQLEDIEGGVIVKALEQTRYNQDGRGQAVRDHVSGAQV